MKPLILNPRFANPVSEKLFLAYCRGLPSTGTLTAKNRGITSAKIAVPPEDQKAFQACQLVVTDLIDQGWHVDVQNGVTECTPPAGHLDMGEEKNRIRAQEQLKRDEGLRRPAISKFIRSMEATTLHTNSFVSVRNLMRDGRELAERIKEVTSSEDFSSTTLRRVVDPYLVFVRGSERCPFTGLLLKDIWKYFRLGWSNQSTSIPGRSMMYLVRDAAAPSHPVMGLGALSSPVIQLAVRDSWIGWDKPSIEQKLLKATPDDARWFEKVLDEEISEIYVQDFIESGLLTDGHLERPSGEVITTLTELATTEADKHRQFGLSADFKTSKGERDDWVARAQTHLFTSKRANLLARLLSVKATFLKFVTEDDQARGLRAMMEHKEGKRALSILLRRVRSAAIGSKVADLTVCGAIAPYNHLIGGKLVGLLALSPETLAEYAARYADTASEIASSTAGRPIVRTPSLVALTTTSLYAPGSSQYNRLKMPWERLGGKSGESAKFQILGRSESYGTSQFSESTVQALVTVSEVHHAGRRINSIFGEGVSPKFRKVREGLDVLNLPSDELLKHGRSRLVYGISLVENLRENLLREQPDPRYLLDTSLGKGGTDAIVDWWMERWLAQRLMSRTVQESITAHEQDGAHGALAPRPLAS